MASLASARIKAVQRGAAMVAKADASPSSMAPVWADMSIEARLHLLMLVRVGDDLCQCNWRDLPGAVRSRIAFVLFQVVSALERIGAAP